MPELKIDWLKVEAAGRVFSAADIELETLTAMGGSYAVNGQTIPPWTLGHLPLLGVVGSPLLGNAEMSDDDALKALTLLVMGRACVSMLMSERHLGDPLFSVACLSVRDDVVGGAGADYGTAKHALRNTFNAHMRGFSFLPRADGGERAEPDAKWLAWAVGITCQKTNCDVFQALWDLPLGMAIWCVVDKLEDDGVMAKRPSDDMAEMAEIRRQMREAAA